MKLSASCLSPMLLAGIIGISVTPVTRWMIRNGMPDFLAILITIAMVILGIGAIIILMVFSVAELIASLPQYQDNLQGQLDSLQTFLHGLGFNSSQVQSSLGLTDPGKILSYVGTMFGRIFGVIS